MNNESMTIKIENNTSKKSSIIPPIVRKVQGT